MQNRPKVHSRQEGRWAQEECLKLVLGLWTWEGSVLEIWANVSLNFQRMGYLSLALPTCWVWGFWALDDQIGTVFFCRLWGLWISTTLLYVTSHFINISIPPCDSLLTHPSHHSQPSGFLTPCIICYPENILLLCNLVMPPHSLPHSTNWISAQTLR
jgi:hypothetical protein